MLQSSRYLSIPLAAKAVNLTLQEVEDLVRNDEIVCLKKGSQIEVKVNSFVRTNRDGSTKKKSEIEYRASRP